MIVSPWQSWNKDADDCRLLDHEWSTYRAAYLDWQIANFLGVRQVHHYVRPCDCNVGQTWDPPEARNPCPVEIHESAITRAYGQMVALKQSQWKKSWWTYFL
ncbi:hypothetical protein [Paraburkholderia sp. BL18I3N2]|uniref:hypothetical protein n=1 Tax=Paraburkholderia sp. BL18I3N2 TaxID=1938799 RepID=UPI0011B27F18|nr:hypothetical protein [Paraburkholderia sp. BL18I3N2]